MIHEDTMIMMADGSMKKISEIRIGDYVMTEMGYIKVSNIYSGQENSLVKIISASGLNITLTTEHIIILLAISKENGIDLSQVLMERKQILIYIWKRLKLIQMKYCQS
ncbi:hypothetical protein BLA28_15960 [Eisenbergiella tayi]|uniref:Hom end-associated Hint n=1 Tax=Eisenbergiella tayi TaxID=1432052 RepID=A0A1E3ANF9_9FIRM|nr:Hint domain-containing protein [Eisenbergiella tayi]ODM09666.1 Hom end-associated Hint [Eisenbergiella tayi]OIZ63413.1 hypothetical protein BLA28_15960 [Eisenbergiella tayi]